MKGLDALYVNWYQYRRLNTHEDAHYAHSHKILGITCLAHFGWRMYMFALYHNMKFDRSWVELGLIAVHSLLHLTSFQFALSSKRNKTYNIIWPEMRMHTMIFAMRSIVTWYLLWLGVNNGPERIVVVFATIACADLVTWYYKTLGKVEENDSTMRGNPYPDYVSKTFIRYHNYFYSVSQVLATMQILHSKTTDAVFALLIPIQTAPFCMTLVKKGILKQAGWHWWYTLALLYNYWISIWRSEGGFIPPIAFYVCLVAFCTLRFGFNANKYFLWAIISGVQLYYNYIKTE